LRLDPAIKTLRSLRTDADIDLVFIDADEPGYISYGDDLVPRVRQGGVLLADNVLWSWDIRRRQYPRAERSRISGVR
jgi:caffeoyl-CoA O-methyltransferase